MSSGSNTRKRAYLETLATPVTLSEMEELNREKGLTVFETRVGLAAGDLGLRAWLPRQRTVKFERTTDRVVGRDDMVRN